jgi:hypothetical protein
MRLSHRGASIHADSNAYFDAYIRFKASHGPCELLDNTIKCLLLLMCNSILDLIFD